jgi:hypothetical protein
MRGKRWIGVASESVHIVSDERALTHCGRRWVDRCSDLRTEPGAIVWAFDQHAFADLCGGIGCLRGGLAGATWLF